MIKTIVLISLAVICFLIFYATVASLKKLKREIFPFYPFDSFFPHEGTWSVGYFLIIIAFLAALIYFLLKGQFVFGPA